MAHQKKHEEKEHAVKEARRLGEENRALKEEKQQLVAMGAEASRGTNLLQQQLALYAVVGLALLRSVF